ncbi:MAG: hypothetical protein AAGC46_00045, partial [Solirubrobacteraceae bacterium]|nr:hypothetical protein [Patulibacter sp.]
MPKPPPSAQRRRPAQRKTTPPPAPLLDQRKLDLIGLGLIAFGVLVAVPLFRTGTGGFLGEAVADGARLLLGWACYGGPLLLIAGGLVAVSRIGVAGSLRIAAGGLAAFSAITLLARASHGPGATVEWSSGHLRVAGGVLGELLWSVCHAAFGSVGPYVIAVLLMIGAALLLTGAEVASVASGAGRGLARALAIPGERRRERRAERAMALAEAPQSVVRAAQEQDWERSLDARERSLAAQARGGRDQENSYALATHGGGTSASSSGTGHARRRRVVPDMAPGPLEASLPADAPRTWTSREADPRTWTSHGGGQDHTSGSSAHLAPPEMPGVTPTVRRGPGARQTELIDGAEH